MSTEPAAGHTGPKVWSDGDVWPQIDAALDKNDVPAAAATLRRYLEFTATILADNLRAPVEFNSNGHYDLGALMLPAVRAWRKTVGDAKEAATSWAKKADVEKLAALEKEVKDRIANTHAEQWMINKAVHFNGWINLQKDEFAAVVSAFKEFLRTMRCEQADCGGYVYVLPKYGERETARCSCGSINMNLKKK